MQIFLNKEDGGLPLPRTLLADSGAGSQRAFFQLVLDEDDCLFCGGVPLYDIKLGGAYVGTFPLYYLSVQIPALEFEQNVRAVGVPSTPRGFEGIACFNFLNQFNYGNFGDPSLFGLEL